MIIFDLDFQRYSSSLYCNKYFETHQEDASIFLHNYSAQLAITSIQSSVETHHYNYHEHNGVSNYCYSSYRWSHSRNNIIVNGDYMYVSL